MWSRAATRLMGRGPGDVAIENWSRHYGVYSSDGTTQLSADELPLLRAMRGENVSTEIVVRNREFPEGLPLDVSGWPLKSETGGAWRAGHIPQCGRAQSCGEADP